MNSTSGVLKMNNRATFITLKDTGLTNLTMHCAHWVHISTGWIARVLDYQRLDSKGSGLSKAG